MPFATHRWCEVDSATMNFAPLGMLLAVRTTVLVDFRHPRASPRFVAIARCLQASKPRVHPRLDIGSGNVQLSLVACVGVRPVRYGVANPAKIARHRVGVFRWYRSIASSLYEQRRCHDAKLSRLVGGRGLQQRTKIRLGNKLAAGN